MAGLRVGQTGLRAGQCGSEGGSMRLCGRGGVRRRQCRPQLRHGRPQPLLQAANLCSVGGRQVGQRGSVGSLTGRRYSRRLSCRLLPAARPLRRPLRIPRAVAVNSAVLKAVGPQRSQRGVQEGSNSRGGGGGRSGAVVANSPTTPTTSPK